MARAIQHDELSAIQHAYNLKLQDPVAFASEYQNEPIDETRSTDEITYDLIVNKFNRIDRGIVPIDCTHLTAFIDVQQHLLYYTVCAWSDEFTGYVVDYGCYPEQSRKYFALRDVQFTLSDATKISGLEASIYAGLTTLTGSLMAANGLVMMGLV